MRKSLEIVGGLTVSNESIRRWVLKFGPTIARNWNETLVTKEFGEQPQCRGLVALGLDQDFENLASLSTARHMYIWRPVS